jgi:hypothetical protein
LDKTSIMAYQNAEEKGQKKTFIFMGADEG